MSHVPVHGNYHGYYLKRPPATDTRLKLLPKDIFERKSVLDIGCNEGWVTCEIAQSWGASKVVGVDIDDSLIRLAWRRRLSSWSLQQPSAGQPDYFPMSLQHSFGPLPILPSAITGLNVFPNNLAFHTANWLNGDIPEDSDGFDVVVAFSISKWIHLNNGDNGIKQFFQKIYNVLSPFGVFILEPQQWDKYKNAKRLDKQIGENAQQLKLRPDMFGEVLSGIGFGPVKHLGETGEGGFRRPVDMYIKNPQNIN